MRTRFLLWDDLAYSHWISLWNGWKHLFYQKNWQWMFDAGKMTGCPATGRRLRQSEAKTLLLHIVKSMWTTFGKGESFKTKVKMLEHPAYAESQPSLRLTAQKWKISNKIGLFPRMFLKRITSRVLVPLLSCGRRIEEIRLRIKAFKELERWKGGKPERYPLPQKRISHNPQGLTWKN